MILTAMTIDLTQYGYNYVAIISDFILLINEIIYISGNILLNMVTR